MRRSFTLLGALLVGAAVFIVLRGSGLAVAERGMYALRASLVALLLLNTLSVIEAAARRALPWTRAILPLFLAGEFALVASHWVPRALGMVSLAALDVVLLIFGVWTVTQMREMLLAEHPESQLEKAFLRFFPEGLARVAAIELTIVASAFRAFGFVWNVQRYNAETYVESAKFRLLVFAMPLVLIPDLVLVQFALPRNWEIAKVALDAIGIYSCLWVLGIFATMAARPHELSGSTLRFHRGILNTAEIAPAAVESVAILGPQRGFSKRGHSNEAYLTVGGVPAVDIKLKNPGTVTGLFQRRGRSVTRVIVASDNPGEFVRKLAH